MEDLIRSKEYVDFLVGRNGDFDILVSSVIKRVKKRLDYGNSSLVLVLPYMTAEYRDNKKSFNEYYDDVEIDDEASRRFYKSAFRYRNRHMVDRSDMVVCYVEKDSGGAYLAKKYAEDSAKKIIDISEE